jgi:hypothetical protein
MEHRDEIDTELSSKELFLQNNQVEYEKPNIYSLEEEFAKTKKNQDWKPYLIFFGFIILLIGATVLTSNYLDVKSKQVNIDITDFEDLRLKETLSAAKEKEQALNRKTEELSNKTQELSSKAQELSNKNKELKSKAGELKDLKSSFNTEVQRIKEQLQQEADLKNVDKKALQRLETKQQKQLDDLRKNYETQMAKKQAEIDRLQVIVKLDELELQKQKGYQYGLSLFLKDHKAAGCIIDPRQRKNILIYIPNNPKLSAETVVVIYRDDEKYIGKLKLIPEATQLRGEIVDVTSNQSVQPWDWFRLPEK